MTRGTMWGMIISASAALGMAVLTKRRRGATRLREAVVRDDQVAEASDESFPASDPPSYTPTIGSSVPH